MSKIQKFLKQLFWPITPVLILLIASLTLLVYASIIYTDSSESLGWGIVLIFTLLLSFLYVLDRVAVYYIKVWIITLAELLIFLFFILIQMESTKKNSIILDTKENWALVIYDSRGIAEDNFSSDGIFDKKYLTNDNILHLDSSFYWESQYRVTVPDSWAGYTMRRCKLNTVKEKYKAKIYRDTRYKADLDSLGNILQKKGIDLIFE